MAVGIKIAHDFNQFQQVNIVYALHFICMLYTAETTKRAKKHRHPLYKYECFCARLSTAGGNRQAPHSHMTMCTLWEREKKKQSVHL